jgi:hypothetical protein
VCAGPALAQAQNPFDGGRDFVLAVGDIDGRHHACANEPIDCADKKLPVRRIQALARLIQQQQPGAFDQRTRQQGHPLQTRRESIQRDLRKLRQLELRQPAPDRRALAGGRRLKQPDRFVEARGDHLEARDRVIEVQVQLRRNPPDASFDFPDRLAAAARLAEDRNLVPISLRVVAEDQA